MKLILYRNLIANLLVLRMFEIKFSIYYFRKDFSRNHATFRIIEGFAFALVNFEHKLPALLSECESKSALPTLLKWLITMIVVLG